MKGGDLLIHHQCAASTWMMRRQPYWARTSTTHQLIGGEETVMKPISVWGWLGGHDGQRPMGKFGIFNDHRESGPRFNVSSEGWCLLTVVSRHYTGALGPTQTTGWAPPAGLTNTSTNSNLVFPGGLTSRYWPGSTLLSFSGQPVMGYRVIWLLADL